MVVILVAWYWFEGNVKKKEDWAEVGWGFRSPPVISRMSMLWRPGQGDEFSLDDEFGFHVEFEVLQLGVQVEKV